VGKLKIINVLVLVSVGLTSASFLFAQDPGSTGTIVTTWQNDTLRTGRNLSETTLVSPLTGLGLNCSIALDGQVYAQPLIETSVNFNLNGTFYTVAYVVTQNDSLYAINAVSTSSTCSQLGYMPLLPILSSNSVTGVNNFAVPCGNIGGKDCATIAPVVGILGTPVINVSDHTGTIYLVTYSYGVDSLGNTHYYHYLHAINIETLQEENGSPVRIAPPGSTSPDTFSLDHIQRPGLLFANGYVYIAFSMMDGYKGYLPNGALFGYNTANLSATPLYFQTSQGLVFNDRTTPATPPHVSTCDPSNCSCSAADGVVQEYWTSTPNYGQVIHTSPAYWQGGGSSYLYMGPQNWDAQNLHGFLTRYSLCSTANSQYPIDSTCGESESAVDSTPTSVIFPNGVTPSISAASATATDAILWALWGDGSTLTTSGTPKVAVLYAFDAADTPKSGVLKELFTSGTTGSNAMTTAATKFSVPTVANGCVYIGTQGTVGVNSGNAGMFYIYGIAGQSCQ
jgi:hypothetical protein